MSQQIKTNLKLFTCQQIMPNAMNTLALNLYKKNSLMQV